MPTAGEPKIQQRSAWTNMGPNVTTTCILTPHIHSPHKPCHVTKSCSWAHGGHGQKARRPVEDKTPPSPDGPISVWPAPSRDRTSRASSLAQPSLGRLKAHLTAGGLLFLGTCPGMAPFTWQLEIQLSGSWNSVRESHIHMQLSERQTVCWRISLRCYFGGLEREIL